MKKSQYQHVLAFCEDLEKAVKGLKYEILDLKIELKATRIQIERLEKEISDKENLL